MDADRNIALQNANVLHYSDKTADQKTKLLNDKDRKSTQAATDGYLRRFKHYLAIKGHDDVDQLSCENLNEVLVDFYCAVQPKKKDGYSVQTFKCMRAGLNRHFRKTRGIDISKDTSFIKANEMFKAVCVDAKKQGRGVKKSIPSITPIDLERIAEYFAHDHITNPDPRRLQQNIIFYIIYYFCRRGRENLYSMTKETFKIVVEPDGTEYIMQNIDELDKNHGIEDSDRTNDGRIYPTHSE